MIAEVKFPRMSKYRTFLVPEEDIWNGNYKKCFMEIFWKYKPMDEYRVNEFHKLGLVIQIPNVFTDPFGAPVALLNVETKRSETKFGEVFKNWVSSSQYSARQSSGT